MSRVKHKSLFDPEKLSIEEFKIIKGQLESPQDFDNNYVEGHSFENRFEMSFNLEDKLVKTDFWIDAESDSLGKNSDEAHCSFHLVFIFKVTNLEELASLDKKNKILVDQQFAKSLAGIVYSTTRGVLLTRLQGTDLNNFILPVINPEKLLGKKN